MFEQTEAYALQLPSRDAVQRDCCDFMNTFPCSSSSLFQTVFQFCKIRKIPGKSLTFTVFGYFSAESPLLCQPSVVPEDLASFKRCPMLPFPFNEGCC